MFRLTRREQVIVIAFLLLILLLSGIYMYGRPGPAPEVPLPRAEQGQPPLPTGGRQEPATAGTGEAKADIKVDVKGAVHTPGVYSLPAGSRVVDAIQAAGGATEQADLQAINLAQKLVDGGMVLVPAKGEAGFGVSSVANPAARDGKINLNTATVEQLDQLDGIGPTRAKAIVEFREKNGPFQSVDDLLKVKGFGPKLLDSIKDRVAVS